MLRLLFASLVCVHGLIHFIGFAKAFHYSAISQFSRDISRPVGLLWALTALLFLLTAGLLIGKKESWWVVGLVAVACSQMLIVSVWADAKVGTLANVVVLIGCALAYGNWRFERVYERDVAEAMQQLQKTNQSVLSDADIQALPTPVRNYLRYVGAVGKPRVRHYTLSFDGQMRDKGKDWFTFTSVQHNFVNPPTRLFFMKARMFGVTVPGYHAYKNGKASMQIKLFGLFPIIDERGDILDQAETVTIFNDMCLFAPSSLMDKRIRWEPVDSLTAKATYTVNEHTISALLYVNEQGQLTNFVSDDRYAIADRKRYRFSTPATNYRPYNGYLLPHYGEAIWHYPDGLFTYGKFSLKDP